MQPPAYESVADIVAERVRALSALGHDVRGRQGLAKHISRLSGRTIRESNIRQWEQGAIPTIVSRRHFAEGAHGGTYDGIAGGQPQTFDTVLARLERAIGSLSNQPGPEITESWVKLPPRIREAENARLDAIAAALEDAVRQGRAQAEAEAAARASVNGSVARPEHGAGTPARSGAVRV